MSESAKKNQDESQGTSTPQPNTAAREQEFNEAADRVYRKYGNNLSAFYRDVQKEVLIKQES